MLILIRHGNTFEAGETPVWVGAHTDMPLTMTGEAQAAAAGRYVAQLDRPISALVAGPLKRTQRTAALVAQGLGKGENAYVIDERLREIGYGQWEGLSGEAIAQRFGAAVLEQWEQHGVWPEGMGWEPSLPQIIAQLEGFLADMRVRCAGGGVVAVTSNGILRLLHGLVTAGAADKAAKVKTGHICLLKPQAQGWRIAAWNVKP